MKKIDILNHAKIIIYIFKCNLKIFKNNTILYAQIAF